MIITTALANEIVARAMAIIHHNVNVIDHHGQIIASGERHRIGEQHEVAREVIRTGKRICINNAAEAARFHNVHPGINHPIIYDDRVVMVFRTNLADLQRAERCFLRGRYADRGAVPCRPLQT